MKKAERTIEDARKAKQAVKFSKALLSEYAKAQKGEDLKGGDKDE